MIDQRFEEGADLKRSMTETERLRWKVIEGNYCSALVALARLSFRSIGSDDRSTMVY
jgi:hypothetical protein